MDAVLLQETLTMEPYSTWRANLLKGLRQTYFRKTCSKEKFNKDSMIPIFCFPLLRRMFSAQDDAALKSF